MGLTAPQIRSTTVGPGKIELVGSPSFGRPHKKLEIKTHSSKIDKNRETGGKKRSHQKGNKSEKGFFEGVRKRPQPRKPIETPVKKTNRDWAKKKKSTRRGQKKTPERRRGHRKGETVGQPYGGGGKVGSGQDNHRQKTTGGKPRGN